MTSAPGRLRFFLASFVVHALILLAAAMWIRPLAVARRPTVAIRVEWAHDEADEIPNEPVCRSEKLLYEPLAADEPFADPSSDRPPELPEATSAAAPDELAKPSPRIPPPAPEFLSRELRHPLVFGHWMLRIRPARALVAPVAEPVPSTTAVSATLSQAVPTPIEGANDPPIYPPRALRLRLEGTVVLAVIVADDGRVVECTITRSSGSGLLDEAARAAIGRWRFRDGPGEVTVPVVFAVASRGSTSAH